MSRKVQILAPAALLEALQPRRVPLAGVVEGQMVGLVWRGREVVGKVICAAGDSARVAHDALGFDTWFQVDRLFEPLMMDMCDIAH